MILFSLCLLQQHTFIEASHPFWRVFCGVMIVQCRLEPNPAVTDNAKESYAFKEADDLFLDLLSVREERSE